MLEDYAEDISYDANGNILTYFRNGDQNESGIEMDNLTYQYERDLEGQLITNRLRYVHDEVQSNSYTADIKTQTSLSQQQVIENLEESQAEDNYQYDETGNLISDVAEGIDRIEWTVYGKIRKITKGTTTIEYGYDAGGNRISKIVDDDGTVVTTFYVRDAQGNVLAVYDDTPGDSYVWREQHLYGSSRLGMVKPEWKAPVNPAYNPTSDPVDNGTVGKRVYELTNHLGNVLVTISDIKIGKDAPGGAEIDYYAADVVTAQDYYPFGMGMPGRKFSGSGLYRYGFNTQEKDNEIAGEGNHYTALYWEMDPRIGRRWNLDPKPVPWESGYAVNRNNPIWVSDPNGDFGNPDKDKKRHERAQKKFDKKVTDPLRKLEASLKESGVNDAVVRKTVQAEADRLADKYQNKSWLHWAIGKPDRDNTASSGYTSGSTGWHFTHRISIRAYKSEVYEVPTIEGDRPADGSMVTTGTVGTVLPGSTVSVQFNPLAQPNSLVVTTDNGSGGLSTIATTGGMISDEENRKGVYMFKTKTAITKVNAGQLQYEVRNSNVDVHKDTWQLKISITSPPVLNPVPLIYSGRPF